jgi:peroxiredoxin
LINQIKVGDKTPDFILLDEKNRTRSLKEFLGPANCRLAIRIKKEMG